jgi:hypothetical protein
VTHGSFRIDAAGTWTSCRDGNVAAGACTGASANGTLESRGGNQWRLKANDGTDIGTVMGLNSAGQNVLVVDLKDKRAGGLGVGMRLGGQQVTVPSSKTDGTWVAATGSGDWILFTASGGNINISQFDWQPVVLSTTFISDNPWTGMATTGWGDTGFLAGAGVYMLQSAAGDAELGVKLR